MTCNKCGSPINPVKAVRRANRGADRGQCACGNNIWLFNSSLTNKTYWMGTSDEEVRQADVKSWEAQ